MHVNNTISQSRASTSEIVTNYAKLGEMPLDQQLENTISDFDLHDHPDLEKLLGFTLATIKENNGKIEVNVRPFEGKNHSVEEICEHLSVQLRSYIDSETVFITQN